MSRFRALVLVAALVSFGAVTPHAQAEEDTRIPTRVELLTDHSQPVKTGSPMPVRVRVTDDQGTPLVGRPVTFWDDSYMRWRCCGPPPKFPTDANGVASTVLYLDGNSANPVRVAVLVHSNETHQKTSVEWYQQLVGRNTTLSVSTVAVRTSGGTLPVTVSVRREDDNPYDNGCIVGSVVKLALIGPDTVEGSATIPNDGSCQATVTLPVSVTPGSYVLKATTGHDGWRRTDEPRTVYRNVTIAWEYTFTDTSGRGFVYLNDETGDYQVVLPDGRDSGVRHAGAGLQQTGVVGTVSVWTIELTHGDATITTDGTFYSTGAFSASGTLDGVPWSLYR